MWIRARLQDQLSQLGYFLQRHAGKVLFLAIVALATFCVALKSAQVHSKVEQLWVQGKCIIEIIPLKRIPLTILDQHTREKSSFCISSNETRVSNRMIFDFCADYSSRIISIKSARQVERPLSLGIDYTQPGPTIKARSNLTLTFGITSVSLSCGD